MDTLREETEDLVSDIETDLMIERLEEMVGHITREDIASAVITPAQLTDEEREEILVNRARAEAVLRQKYGYEL